MKWQKLPNGKWRRIKGSSFDPSSPEYQRKSMAKKRKVICYCETCKSDYSLADPCIHHLPDGYQNDQRRKFWKTSKKPQSDPNQSRI
tara:strand:- start:1642 stop:1902 length:261 start_codon:yes stop_codon:yes gene_type:complete